MRRFITILLGITVGIWAIAAVATPTVSPETEVFSVNNIQISGNKEIPDEVILSMMETKVGSRFSTERLVNEYNKLIKLDYVETISIFPKIANNGINLEVQVVEKNNAKELLTKAGIVSKSERDTGTTNVPVTTLEINGLVHLKSSDFLKEMPLKVGGYFSTKKALDSQKYLMESGYFRDVQVHKQETDNGMIVVYTVVENPVLNGINIIGNTVYTTAELTKLMKTKSGEVFSVAKIREDKDAIISKYNDAGYVLAELKDIGITNDGVLEIILTEGVVRNVKFKKMVTKNKGDRRKPTDDILKTKEFVISREVELKEGDVFNIKKYDETSKNLMRLGIFKNVKYEANNIPGDAEGKSVVLLIDEDRTATLQGAISYGSQVGLLGSISVRDSNWAGRNQNIGISYEQSNKDWTSYSIDFSDPWIKGTDRVSWGWGLFKSSSSISNSFLYNQIETYGARLNVGKGISKNWRLGIGTKVERVIESDPNGYEWDRYYLGSFYPSIVYDTRNNIMNPTSGEFMKYQVEAGRATGYKADYFASTTLELRKYHRGLFKKNTMAYKAEFGIISRTSKESQRFTVGGSNLRGYDGGFFRGTKEAIGTIENRTQFNDVLGLVFFADAGRAWDQKGRDPGYDYDKPFAEEIAYTAGVGLRVNTPMGPLRFDFGWPIGQKIGNAGGMQFYFNMGQSF